MAESQFGNGQNPKIKDSEEVEAEEEVEEVIAAEAIIKEIKEEDIKRQIEVIKHSFYIFW